MIDLSGHKYNQLTVISFDRRENGRDIWVCQCDCGEQISVKANALRTGNTKSCGCLKKEKLKMANEAKRTESVALGNSWVDRLKAVFTYDAKTGIVSRKETKGRRLVCGTLTKDGYLATSLEGRKIYVHRLAWFLHYGELLKPEEFLDHADMDKLNNKISNLRRATRAQNIANCSVWKTNSLGVKGVIRKRGKFAARIMKNGVLRFIGSYSTASEAKAAYDAAAKEIYGEFARSA